MNPNNPRAAEPRSARRLLVYILREIVRQRRWLLLPLWMLLAGIVLLFFLSSGAYLIPAIYLSF